MTLTEAIAIELRAIMRGRGQTFEESAAEWLTLDQTGQEFYMRQAARIELRIKRFREQNTDRTIPCPTCGFVVKTVERQPFVYRDDD
jgi:hypothetical protein